MDKKFSTTNMQLRTLRTRGMVISNGSRAKKIIELENYYNLINGYKGLFLDRAIPVPMKPICPVQNLMRSTLSICLTASCGIFLSAIFLRSKTM